MKIYNKLIRDKIPDIIESDGKSCDIEIASKAQHYELLKEKLIEETNEFMEDESLEELADIMEVIFSLAESLGHQEKDLLYKRQEKKEQRGGFEKGIILKKVY